MAAIANVDDAIDHLADLVTTEKVLKALPSGALHALGMAALALLHAQETGNYSDDAETPVETLLHAVPMFNDDSRNMVGSIACAVLNMQTAAQRDPAAVRRLLNRALKRVEA